MFRPTTVTERIIELIPKKITPKQMSHEILKHSKASAIISPSFDFLEEAVWILRKVHCMPIRISRLRCPDISFSLFQSDIISAIKLSILKKFGGNKS